MPLLSVVVISKNEERNIRRCLESVAFADEIILIDSQSVDNTRNIAEEFGAKIYSPEWNGFGPAKQEGVRRASHNWILSIDADEVVSPELKDEIIKILGAESKFSGYYVPRCTNFIGRWIRHSGWYPDYVLRLFDKTKGNFNDAYVHEKVVVSGETDRLKNDLLHYSYPTMEDYFDKFNYYTTVGAEELYKKGKKASWGKILIKPLAQFIKQFILKAGFLDGVEGFLISFLSAVAVMVKYTKLRALNNTMKADK